MDFQGSGYKGFEFEMKGYQERNLQLFLERMGTKEAQKTITELAKIRPESWREMGGIMTTLQEITTAGIAEGSNLGVIEDLTSSITETIKVELDNALTPLKNELIGAMNTALEPLMPYVEEGANWFAEFFSIGLEGIIALIRSLFGDFQGWTDLYRRLGNIDWMVQGQSWSWDRILAPLSDPNSPFGAAWYLAHGINVAELNQSGTEGGLYSGQFDLSPEAIEALSHLDIGPINLEGLNL